MTNEVIDELDTNENAEVEDQTGWSRQQVAQSLVRRHAAAATAAGFIPVPLGDVTGISATALNLIKRLSDLYEVGFSREAGLNIITTLASGATPLALKGTAISMLKAIPGVGTYAGLASMPVLGGAVVYSTGQVMIRHYESGGNLLNLDAKGAREYFREQLSQQRDAKAKS